MKPPMLIINEDKQITPDQFEFLKSWKSGTRHQRTLCREEYILDNSAVMTMEEFNELAASIGLSPEALHERVQQHYAGSPSNVRTSVEFIRDTYLYLIPRLPEDD